MKKKKPLKKPRIKKKREGFRLSKKLKKKKIDIKRNTVRRPEEIDSIHRTRIQLIGLGGGGSSIVSELAGRLKKADFVLANTDSRALKQAPKNAKKFQFGQDLTRGLGTGMNIEMGKTAALNEKERIKNLMQGYDLCIIVSCLGGGTGSGAAQVFAKTSRDLGNITYGIFTLPFQFEGEKKMEIAQKSLEKIRLNLDALSIIPNEKIFDIIDKNTPISDALSAINKKLSESLQGLIETIYEPGLINIDFADLKAILIDNVSSDASAITVSVTKIEGENSEIAPRRSAGKLVYLNTIELQGQNRTEEAIKKVITSPLYPYTIGGARGILFNITGEKSLSLSEVNQISRMITEMVNPDAKIIFGVSYRNDYKDKIKITLLAVGCTIKTFNDKAYQVMRKMKIIKERPVAEEAKEVKEAKEDDSQDRAGSKQPQKDKKIEQKKIKIAIKKEAKPSQDQKPAHTEKKEAVPAFAQAVKTIALSGEVSAVKVRKNALQLKKEVEEVEKEFLEQEKMWEAPAFLRRKIEKLNEN